MLTSRERVIETLNHREPDMVPIDFGGMRSTGISAMAYNKLKEYLGVHGGQTKVYDIFQMLAEPELEVLNIMGGDVIQLHRYEPAWGIDISSWKPWILPDGSPCVVPAEFDPVQDEEGNLSIVRDGQVIARMPEGGFYFDQVYHPYAEVETYDDIDSIPINEISDIELEFLKENARRMYEQTDYAILGSFGGNILEAGQQDWGFEKFYMAMALQPDLVHYYLERLTQSYMRDLEKYLEAVGRYLTVIQFGDDLGTQEAPQISPKMYREVIKPYHSRMYQYVQNHYPEIKVFLHSCGAIYDLIPDLIDAGVQIINPVQISAKGMDPVLLKKEFGNDLTFWGGGANMQYTVPNGTIEQIKREVEKLVHVFAPGGGYVFTQVHNIQANVPPEKIMAIYDTAKAHRVYPQL
ncbi:uroporphyrinogen decarboxylase family protein [Mahella australiensis]|uniref:Methyltransferase CmuC n=1 Tax=Mahella australiensis (strain DSM 15567 / CIP 107919 / 50-1 BON) TaxID=697281 RepID=F4A163_MAHA5|nr:putative methyltransferase CmuC [Mahella australiensis 50-1 BON]